MFESPVNIEVGEVLLGRLERIEFEKIVRMEVREDLLTRWERIEFSLKVINMRNEPSISAVDTRRVDINNYSSNKAFIPPVSSTYRMIQKSLPNLLTRVPYPKIC